MLFKNSGKNYVYSSLQVSLLTMTYFTRKDHSTEQAKVQLVDQIRNSFESNQYTLGIFCQPFQSF